MQSALTIAICLISYRNYYNWGYIELVDKLNVSFFKA